MRGAKGARPLCLTEDPRLPRASKGSQGFLTPQEVLRGPGKLRGQGGVRGSKREVGVMEIMGYVLGSLPPVGPIFGVAHHFS